MAMLVSDQVLVIGGAPGAGKTTFALSLVGRLLQQEDTEASGAAVGTSLQQDYTTWYGHAYGKLPEQAAEQVGVK